MTSSRRAVTPEVDEFERYFAPELITDGGGSLRLQDWQALVLGDILGGAQETLVLLPKGSGKTTLFAALALFHLVMTDDAACYIAASSRDQATLMYDHARGFVRRSPGLEERILVRNGTREMRSRSDSGFIKVLASDVDHADGVGPTLALVDELHRHKTADLYGVFRDGLAKRNGQLCTISTAGDDPSSPLGEMRAAALDLSAKRDGSHVCARSDDGDFVMHEWSVPEGADTNDLEVVKAANPSEFVTVESLRKRQQSPSMRSVHWLRFACNQWVDAENPWIDADEWDACAGEVDLADAGLYLGVDIGQVYDSSAVATVGIVDGVLHVRCRVWTPTPDTPVDIGQVEAHVVAEAEAGRVMEVAYDPFRFQRSAEVLEERGLAMVEFPQSNARMHEASNTLYDLVREGKVVHDGDGLLRSHVLAGVAVETEVGWRISKRKSKRKIDALIALAIAGQRAVANERDSIYNHRELLVL